MFNKNKERTPAQEAERSLLGVVARLAGCAYLVYVIIKLFKEPDLTSGRIALIGVLIVAGLAVIAMTVIDFISKLKVGMFKPETYYTEEYLEKLKQEQEEYRREHPEEFLDEEEEDEETDEEADDTDEE